MARKHIVYIVSHIHKSLAFEWITLGLKFDYRLSFILLNPSSSALEDFLIRNKVEVKHIHYRDKRDFISAFFKTFFFFLFKRPDVVHAHLFDAQLIGLTSARLALIKRRIYTRHNSNYHHVYYPRGVRFDVWSNRMATDIISISQATDFTLLQLESAPTSKVVRIPHGFDLEIFNAISLERTQQVKEQWKIGNQHPVIGVIARHIEWKGIQYIISAFRKFQHQYPNACLVLANATGPYHDTVVELLKAIPEESVIQIPFEEDVAALYSNFDFFVHVPIDPLCEAFGQTYVEALAAGIPSIFTLSGIAAEFIVHERNSLVVEFKNDKAIYQAMKRLWEDKELRNHLIKNGRQDVISQFGIASMLTSLKRLYDR